MIGGIERVTGALFLLVTGLLAPLAVAGDEKLEKIRVVPVAERGQPVAAKTDSQGTIHLLLDSPDGPRYMRSTDNGVTFAPSIPVVDAKSKKPGLEFHSSDMAVGPDGRVHVAMMTNAWKLKLPQEEWGFYYARLEPGAQTFTPVQNINRKPSEGFSLAADDKGNVTACWLSDKLYANVSHDHGKTFAPFTEIDPTFNPCNCCTTSAEYGTDGKLAVLYREETKDERDMYLVLWDQRRGQVTRSRVSTTLWKIASCPMTYYTVHRDQDGFVAVWPTRNQIYFGRIDGKGQLLPPGEIKTTGIGGMRTGMLALTAPDRSTLVAWTKNSELGWQVYGADNLPMGVPGSAKSSGNGIAAVVGKDGRFILFR